MEITYKIDKERKLIIETWPENLTLDNYKEVKMKEFSDPEFNKKFNVITDLRKVRMEFDEEIIRAIVDFMKKNSDKMQNRKSAVVADSPQLVASSFFFGQRTRSLSVKVSIFSTLEAAEKWILEKWH